MSATNYPTYVPVESIMYRDDRSRKYFENMMRSRYNHGRVIRDEGGKLMVDPNYDIGDRHEIYELYLQAEHLAGNTHRLAVYLARMLNRSAADQRSSSHPNSLAYKLRSKNKKPPQYRDVNALYLYLRYGAFKHFERAAYVKAVLRRFITENSLFGVQS